MQLHEEFKEYETMWDEVHSEEEESTTLTEGIIVQKVAEIIGVISFFVGTLGALGTWVTIGGAAALMVAIISMAVKVIAELISEATLPVFPLTIGEALTDDETTSKEIVLEQTIANVNILQKAQTNSKIQKQVQGLYKLIGPEKAQMIILRLETWMRKHSKQLARVFKDVKVKDLEANEDIIIQKALDRAQKEAIKASSNKT